MALFLILTAHSCRTDLEFRVKEDYSFLLCQISTDRMMDNIKKLSGFGTRYVLTTECNESATYLFNYFLRLKSYNVSFHFFKLSGWNSEIPLQETYVSANVVASKVGFSATNKTTKEYVILCAHYDSISRQPYTSAPGAEDNAAGVAVLMEIAQILDLYFLNRTVLFIAFSGEEIGLQGSKAWVSENNEILSSSVGVLCLDGIGRGEKIDIFYTLYSDISSNSEELAEFILSIAVGLGYTNFHKQLSLKSGSDDFSFEGKAKVVRLWDNDKQYIHTPLDMPDTINSDRLKQVAALMLVATYKLATRPLNEILMPIKPLDKASIRMLIVGSLATTGLGIAPIIMIKIKRHRRMVVCQHQKSSS